ncbi:MAG TPA: sterol desaturase family protein [Gemmataceae bacterium]|nr:sterol desaturase family protein [Gemmataceae bacterium]
MEWIADIWYPTLTVVKYMVVFGLAFGLLSWLMPCNPGMYWWTNLRTAATDFCYWLVAPIFVRICQIYMLALSINLLFAGGPVGFAFLFEQPILVQCILIQVLQDVYLYWMHRVFHTPVGWRFHSVHHSTKVLDWLGGARNHMVNSLMTFIMADILCMLVGFSPEAIGWLAPFNIIWSSLVHANLNWSFGPLRYLIASPVFHRWHHTLETEGLDKNFAPTFPILDVIFGTFYMPAGKLPANFGNGEPDYPEGFIGQFLYPFLGKSSSESEAATSRNAA